MSVEESYTLEDDDGRLRPLIARAVFAVRPLLIFLFAVATAFFAWQAS